MKTRIRPLLAASLWFWLVLAIAVLLAPLSLHLGLLDALRVPVLLAALALAPAAFVTRRYRSGFLVLVLSMALLSPWLASGRTPVGQDSRRIKLVMLPSSSAEAIAYAMARQADVILIPDFSATTVPALAPLPMVVPAPAQASPTGTPLDMLTADYRPWILKASDGIGIFLRAGIGDIDGIRVRDATPNSRAFVVDANLAGTEVTLAIVHLTRPFPLAPFGLQAGEMATLGKRLAEIPRPVILAGDFNALPWSGTLGHLAGAMSAGSAQWVGTFPSASPIRLAIDQVRVSGGLQITALEAGPYVGSVHLPVEAIIALPPR